MGLKESETTMFSHLYTKPECYRQTDRQNYRGLHSYTPGDVCDKKYN